MKKNEIITGLLMGAIVMAVYVLIISVASAEEYLVCAPATFPATQAQVEIIRADATTVVTIPYGDTDADGDVLLVNLAEYTPGAYTFRYRLADESGWWAAWSDELRAVKPGKPGSRMRIK